MNLETKKKEKNSLSRTAQGLLYKARTPPKHLRSHHSGNFEAGKVKIALRRTRQQGRCCLPCQKRHTPWCSSAPVPFPFATPRVRLFRERYF